MEPKNVSHTNPPQSLSAQLAPHFLDRTSRGGGGTSDGFEPPELNLLTRAEALARLRKLAECVHQSAKQQNDEWKRPWRNYSDFERAAVFRVGDPEVRASVVIDLLKISETLRDRSATEAAVDILSACHDLQDGARVVNLVGAEKLIFSPYSEFLQEIVFLLTLWPRMKGVEGLPPPDSVHDLAEALEPLRLLEERLRGNLELFHAATIDRSQIPPIQCSGAEILIREFQIARGELSAPADEPRDIPSLREDGAQSADLWALAQSILSRGNNAPVEQSGQEPASPWTSPAELYARYYHKLDAWHYSGLALVDSAERRWDAAIAAAVAEALKLYPARIYFFQGVALHIARVPQPFERPEAQGASLLGRILLFDFGASIEPDTAEPQITRAGRTTLHEVGHCCHTVFHDEFNRLSGWNFLPRGEYTLMGEDTISHRGKSIRSGDEIIRHGETHRLAIEGDTAWTYRDGARFVNDYAAVSPFEDDAESLTMYFLNPLALSTAAPAKFRFIDYVYGRGAK